MLFGVSLSLLTVQVQPKLVHVGVVVYEVALKQVFL